MLSGFFTQLVYEQRGLKKLMQQRFERIAIPLVLASLCILPLNNFVLQRAAASRHREPVIEAIVRGDIDFLKSWLLSGGDPNHEDGIFFRRLVSWASLSDNAPHSGSFARIKQTSTHKTALETHPYILPSTSVPQKLLNS
jgi:hypothetical protein